MLYSELGFIEKIVDQAGAVLHKASKSGCVYSEALDAIWQLPLEQQRLMRLSSDNEYHHDRNFAATPFSSHPAIAHFIAENPHCVVLTAQPDLRLDMALATHRLQSTPVFDPGDVDGMKPFSAIPCVTLTLPNFQRNFARNSIALDFDSG